MYLYPKEILADTYVSKVGGFSSELDEREIGINALALSMNTSIIANETEARLRFFDDRPLPYFLRRSYRIVGLEENMDGFEASPNGEVVFSEKCELRDVEGRDVIINTVESFRIDGDYSSVVRALRRRVWL
ncbi:hypothetical protein [Archaeoglobus veneficus]|uniref:Uncharacterized protein n=1 Tax=Archaeoglobus veneficus (strain DSM 11195 / SNP6) TaxID=693661 RepID=F2KNX9_ARCVS|nr:hypothetical protein [Archaeoglobus veneficus]AEA47456.1 hypothetical protein Arcve_1453 [Archaeoglobus veneficus SNP6]